MSKEFVAFRLKPGEDDDIIAILENTLDKTKFIKECIRISVKFTREQLESLKEEAEV